MSKLGSFFLALILSASFACAQTAEVVHNVNLRSDPSTSNPAIVKLLPGAHLQLIDADSVGGYYHVKTTTGQIGFVWGKNVQIEAAGNGPQPTPAHPATNPTTAGVSSAPVPLLAKGHPVDWWFVFKFNSASFPKCGATAVRSCPFGGDVQNYSKYSQQFVFSSSENHALQQGSNCLGDTTDDPVGATPIVVLVSSTTHSTTLTPFWGSGARALLRLG